MRILVTGGAGYVGSHVVRDLMAAGHEPVVLDNLSKGHLEAVPPGVSLVKADLADKETLSEVFRRYQPQAVMHFAGSSLVGESMREPELYFRNNLSNGLQLLACMVQHDVDKMVFSSSAAVYGEPETVPITEEHPKRPTNPYGESKLFFEAMLARFEKAYGLRSICLRYFNAAGAHPSGEIGEDHTPETHLIPIILQTALGKREELAIFGTDYPTDDGTCVRDYVHVCDLSAAHLLALQALATGAPSNAFNLGNGQGFSVREILSVAETVVGRPIATRIAERRPGDPAILVASAEKAQQELGWRPSRADIRDIVESAWSWHMGHPEGYGLQQ
ncbi:MAG: UDP-glucose 4-epimerase GalE [Limnochordia bacterium]|jgi:UDP-glucose 4-epimerase